MSLPDYFLDRVTADIRQQMAGIVALTNQLARQRLTPDGQACVSSVAEAAEGVRRMLDAAACAAGFVCACAVVPRTAASRALVARR